MTPPALQADAVIEEFLNEWLGLATRQFMHCAERLSAESNAEIGKRQRKTMNEARDLLARVVNRCLPAPPLPTKPQPDAVTNGKPAQPARK